MARGVNIAARRSTADLRQTAPCGYGSRLFAGTTS